MNTGGFFTLEMVLKISANPSRFFLGAAWTMNLLDFFLMALQWLDATWLAQNIQVNHEEGEAMSRACA